MTQIHARTVPRSQLHLMLRILGETCVRLLFFSYMSGRQRAAINHHLCRAPRVLSPFLIMPPHTGNKGSSPRLSFPFPKANDFPDDNMDMVIPGAGHREVRSRRRRGVGAADCADRLLIPGRKNKFSGGIVPERQRHFFHRVEPRVFVHIHA